MNNFRIHTPTEIIFGKDTHKQVGDEVSKYTKKILLVRLTEQSLKSKGIYDDLMTSLNNANIEVFHLDGIQPNPLISKVREGVELCKNNSIDFVLAVGGGSVLDTAKAICAGACVDFDVWEFFNGKTMEKHLKLGTIVTIPATGSEMNTRCVITDDKTDVKKGASFNQPVFSILNPEFCKTLPKNRISQVVVDSLSHSMERYFTNTEHVELTDSMLEGVMRTLITFGKKFYIDGYDYDTVSQVMYGSTLSHNFTLCVGRVNDFGSHNISFPLSGYHDVPHAEAISIIFPAWLKYVKNHNKERLAQFFTRVLGTKEDKNLDIVIDNGIKDLENLYKELNSPIRMSDVGITNPDIELFADVCTNNGAMAVGNYVKLTRDDLVEIYKLAL